MRILAATSCPTRVRGARRVAKIFGGCSGLLLLAACAGGPQQTGGNGRVWDPRLGVWSSPRLVADGEAVPRGGGAYLTGRPYVIGGRTYVPSQNPAGYAAVGMASWYGDAFHGRRTANGEIFDKGSISAAHPTLPLPSYVRVTNLRNGRSMVVRVNDRGPYHGGRVMDVSQRVADALAFRGEGTAHVRIEYVGRAPLQGSDDDKLLATLRSDGTPAQLEGQPAAAPVMTARESQGESSALPDTPATAATEVQPEASRDDATLPVALRQRRRPVPLPPARPFILGRAEPREPALDPVGALLDPGPRPPGSAAQRLVLTLVGDGPFPSIAKRGTLDAGDPDPAGAL